MLFEHGVVPGVEETFYAITVERTFEHPILAGLLARDEAELLTAAATARRQVRS